VVPENEEDRLRLLHGVLYTPIVAREIFEGVAEAANGRLDFEVFDGPDTSRANLVYDLDQTVNQQSPDTPVRAYGRHFETRVSLTIGDRVFGLHASAATFDSAYSHAAVWAAALGGARAHVAGRLPSRRRTGTHQRRRRAQSTWIGWRRSNTSTPRPSPMRGRITPPTPLSRACRATRAARAHTRIWWTAAERARGAGAVAAGLRGQQVHAGSTAPRTLYWLRRRSPCANRLTGFMEIGTDITATRAADALVGTRAAIVAGTHAGEGEINVRTGELRMSERWARCWATRCRRSNCWRAATSGLFTPETCAPHGSDPQLPAGRDAVY
jgi:hypothetical protein